MYTKMDLLTVKTCFEKYVTYVEQHEKIHSPEQINIDTMTIQDIDRLTQLIFMDYAIKCNEKISQFSVPCTLYKHVDSLIRRYIQDESNKTNGQLQEHIIKLQEESKTKPQSIPLVPITPQKSKGWFF